MIILEFFKSPSWRDIQLRVLAMLGFSGMGTMANAIPTTITAEQAQQLVKLDILMKYLAVGSYMLSAIVALTVLARFGIWLYDRYKNKNKQ